MTDTKISPHVDGLNRDTGLSLYRTMQTIRQTEEQLARYHQRGLATGRVESNERGNDGKQGHI